MVKGLRAGSGLEAWHTSAMNKGSPDYRMANDLLLVKARPAGQEFAQHSLKGKEMGFVKQKLSAVSTEKSRRVISACSLLTPRKPDPMVDEVKIKTLTLFMQTF